MRRSIRVWFAETFDKKGIVTGVILITAGLAVSVPGGYVSGQIAQARVQQDVELNKSRLDKVEERLDQTVAPSAQIAAEVEFLKRQLEEIKRIEAQHHAESIQRTDRIIEILLGRK